MVGGWLLIKWLIFILGGLKILYKKEEVYFRWIKELYVKNYYYILNEFDNFEKFVYWYLNVFKLKMLKL